MSRRARTVLQASAALLIVAAVVFFFRAQFVKNWEQVRNVHFKIDYLLLLLSLACTAASYLVNTAAWRYGINLFSTSRPFSFTQSIGMVNATQLTKYIPGKVWGYAMQATLVDRQEFPVSTILYINIFLALSSAFICLLVGGVYLVFSSLLLPRLVLILVTAAVLLIYIFFLAFNSSFFSFLTRILGRILKKSINFRRITFGQTMRMQLLSLASSAALGLSALFCAAGVGFSMDGRLAYSVFSGFLVSDTIGFLAFLVPGGIGIREGLFYLLLREHGGESLALILPIVMRLLSMCVDATLGVVGLVYLRKYVKEIPR
jgi:glycosyltransferase 2 family protein